jgi:hypothetical protein
MFLLRYEKPKSGTLGALVMWACNSKGKVYLKDNDM